MCPNLKKSEIRPVDKAINSGQIGIKRDFSFFSGALKCYSGSNFRDWFAKNTLFLHPPRGVRSTQIYIVAGIL